MPFSYGFPHTYVFGYDAFQVARVLYEFLRKPFGLDNAPAVFQRAINKALKDHSGRIAHVYIDDILIPSETFTKALCNLKQVLRAHISNIAN